MREERGPYKIAAPFQNCVLFGVLSIVALFNGYDEGDQHCAGNRSRSKNRQIERGPDMRSGSRTEAHNLGRRWSGCTRSTKRGKKSLPSIFTCAKRRISPVLFERK